MTRVLLGDQAGRVRAELRNGSIGSIAWRLNSSGTAVLTISRLDPAFRQELLEPGCTIYTEFDNGLPAWGGVLDLPRTWSPGKLETRVYTIERRLSFAMTEKTRPFYGVVVGKIFSDILEEAEQEISVGLTLGQIWMGGQLHYPRYHLRDAMWIIKSSIQKMESCDYTFIPYLEGNRIKFRAELHQLLGDDKRDKVALIEGRNVTEPALTEQGDIVNRVAVAGSGTTWSEREVIIGNEDTSRRRYGLREEALTPSDVTQTSTLSRYAEQELAENAYPHTLASMGVVDLPPARYADYQVGDIVRVQLPSYGFEGYDKAMRITARGYDPSSGACEVVCEERFGISTNISVVDAEPTTD
jgi:hypothetical protein